MLDSIDEAIERTEAVIAATERLRESLLHELLSRGVPGWHSAWKEVRGIGTIPSDWEVVRLVTYMRYSCGKTPTTRNGSTYLGSRSRHLIVPVYGANGVHGFHNRSINEGPGKLSPVGAYWYAVGLVHYSGQDRSVILAT